VARYDDWSGRGEQSLHWIPLSTDALPESYWLSLSRQYRNAGLLTDLKAIQLRPGALGDEFYPNGKDMPPRLPADHPAIIEWRALTVIGL
jgi:hypothetical protein